MTMTHNETRARISAALKARRDVMRLNNVQLAAMTTAERGAIQKLLNGRVGSDRYTDEVCKALEWSVPDMLRAAAEVAL